MKNEDLLEEVAKELSLPFRNVKEVVSLVFEDIKNKMQGDLPVDFMFKYLGKLKIFPGRIKGRTNIAKKQFEDGKISEEEYLKTLKYLEHYETATTKGFNKRGNSIK